MPKVLPELLTDDSFIEQVTKIANLIAKKRYPLLGENYIKFCDVEITLEALAKILNMWLEEKRNGRKKKIVGTWKLEEKGKEYG